MGRELALDIVFPFPRGKFLSDVIHNCRAAYRGREVMVVDMVGDSRGGFSLSRRGDEISVDALVAPVLLATPDVAAAYPGALQSKYSFLLGLADVEEGMARIEVDEKDIYSIAAAAQVLIDPGFLKTATDEYGVHCHIHDADRWKEFVMLITP